MTQKWDFSIFVHAQNKVVVIKQYMGVGSGNRAVTDLLNIVISEKAEAEGEY